MSSSSVYDEIEIEDMEYDSKEEMYSYPCPCGDTFYIYLEDLHDGDNIAKCPSCTLTIRIIYEKEKLPKCNEEPEEEIGNNLEVSIVA